MRITRVAIVVWLGAVAIVAGQAPAPQTEKPTEAYQKAMKDINVSNMSLRADVAAKNFEAITKTAGVLKAGFQQSLDFWTARKIEDATTFAKNALKAATDLETVAKASNEEGVAAAARGVSGSCQPCHMAHRQRMPDGSYEIK